MGRFGELRSVAMFYNAFLREVSTSGGRSWQLVPANGIPSPSRPLNKTLSNPFFFFQYTSEHQSDPLRKQVPLFF